MACHCLQINSFHLNKTMLWKQLSGNKNQLSTVPLVQIEIISQFSQTILFFTSYEDLYRLSLFIKIHKETYNETYNSIELVLQSIRNIF